MKLLGLVALLLLALTACQGEESQPAPMPEAASQQAVPKHLARCVQFKDDIRRANFLYWGVDFPYWYAIGQAQQESSCRADITAFDGGQGLFQFMPATAKEVEGKMREAVDPNIAADAIRMNAYYMRQLHNQNWTGWLWLTYQAYNGGWGNLKKEYQRAGVSDWALMKSQCQRKKVTLKSGQVLDFCEVNYDYSRKVRINGDYFRIGDDCISFWGS